MNRTDIVSCIIQFLLQSVNYKPRNVVFIVLEFRRDVRYGHTAETQTKHTEA